MKALRILFAILLSVLLFVSQAALFCLFVADRLISPAALTSAVEGAGLMDSIVSDLMTSMDLAADAADAGPLNAYAGRLAADVVASLVRGDALPHVDETELAGLLSDLLVPAIGDTAETVGALMATELASQLNDMLASRLSLAVTLGITTRSLAILETLFSPVTRILLAVAILLFGLLLVLVLGKRRRKGRIGLIWWSVTAALSGIAVLLCGVGMNSALLSARDRIAKCLNASPREIYFTSGGSEADNQAILSAARLGERKGKKHIISTAFEHHAVLHTLKKLEKEGFTVELLPVGPIGTVTAQQVKRAIREDTCLVSVMYANNEIGSILPISEIGAVCREAGVLFHTDAVQAVGHLPIDVKAQNIDLLSLSAHKFHGPKGIGALYIRSGLKLPPYIHGGGQERGIRAGTEPTPQIAAFGVAAEIASAKMAEATKTMAELRTHAIDRLTAEVEGVTVIGGGAPHILSISLPGYRSEVLMNFLEAREIYTSKSSACKKGGRSHVLEAIGLPSNVIDGALRISFSRYTTREDIDALCDALRDAKQSLFPSLH